MASGCGTLLEKFDVARIYCSVAIFPLNRPLLSMKGQEKCFVDMALLFGFWTAPYIFTAITDVVQWMLTSHHGVDFHCHYLHEP